MDQDLKNVIRETWKDQILPVILIGLGLTLAYEIGHSNLDSLTIWNNYFYLPLVLAFLMCKIFYTRYFKKFGSFIFVYLLLTTFWVVFLPLCNRLYVQKNHSFKDRRVTGRDTESTAISDGFSAGTLLKKHFVTVDLPEWVRVPAPVVLPVNKEMFYKCEKAPCKASFNLKLGLLGAHYVDNVQVELSQRD